MKQRFFFVQVAILGLLFSNSVVRAQGQFAITAGTTIQHDGTVHWTLEDVDWNQAGNVISGQSIVTFSGQQTSSVGGSNSPTFYQLILDKSQGTLTLTNAIFVKDILRFDQGNLDLNGQILDLDISGQLSQEAETKRVLDNVGGGMVQRTADLNTPTLASPGNLGMTLTSSSNLGTTVIQRKHDPPSINGGAGMSRQIEIIPTNNSGLNATVRIDYFDAELNGLTESNLLLFTSSNGGSTWSELLSTQRDAVQNFVQISGLSSLDQLGIAESPTTFPVSWLGIEGKWLPNAPVSTARITWDIVPDQPLSHFEVWRRSSASERQWQQVGRISPQATSTSIQTYSFDDRVVHTQTPDRYWYQVRAVGLDGDMKISPTVQLAVFDSFESHLSLWPNPAHTSVHLLLPSQLESAVLHARIYDGRGQLVKDLPIPPQRDRQVSLPVRGLPDGMYMVYIQGEGRMWQARFRVER